MGKNQHVIPHPDGGWQVKGAGNSRATARTTTQQQAINIARSISRNQSSELVIHFIDLMDKYVKKILMGIIHIPLKDRFCN